MKKNENIKKTLEAGALTKRHSEGIRPKNPLHILKRFFAEYKLPFAGNCIKPAQNDAKFLASLTQDPTPKSKISTLSHMARSFTRLASSSVQLVPQGAGIKLTSARLCRGEGRNNVKHLFTHSLIHLFTPKKKAAFTLAEVLITLGIIGVVAAMTIPALINANKAQRLRSQFNKSYSTIQQAFRQMEADDESTDPSSYSQHGTFYKTFMKHFQGALDCGALNVSSRKDVPCYIANSDKDGYDETKLYRSLDGKSRVLTNYFDDGQIALQDGTLIMMENAGGRLYLSVDINGYVTPPNRWGYDLFTFQLIDGELIPMGNRRSTYNDTNTYCNINGTGGFNGIACAELAKNNTDYFKYIVKNLK